MSFHYLRKNINGPFFYRSYLGNDKKKFKLGFYFSNFSLQIDSSVCRCVKQFIGNADIWPECLKIRVKNLRSIWGPLTIIYHKGVECVPPINGGMRCIMINWNVRLLTSMGLFYISYHAACTVNNSGELGKTLCPQMWRTWLPRFQCCVHRYTGNYITILKVTAGVWALTIR